jgi:hypothetical protein
MCITVAAMTTIPALIRFSPLDVVILLFLPAVLIIPAVFYCLSLQKALSLVSLQNRAMSPGLVWLLLIPFFGIVWHFFVVLNMAKSLGAEFKQRNTITEPEPGKGLGLAMCILGCCCLIPIVNIFCGIALLVCWIMYWVKIAGFSGRLAAQVA